MRRTAILVTLVALLALASLALTQGQTRGSAPAALGYTLNWWTVDSGGTSDSSSGGYTLGGTAGQPDAATWQGQGYTLAGGFWGGAAAEYRVYLPLVLRD
jgi:hypothetical protein